MRSPAANPLVAAQSPPPIPAVQAWASSYDGGHGPLMDLSQAAPGYPPSPDLLALLGAAAASPACAGYGPIQGEPRMRVAYARHLADTYGAPVEPAQIQITAGCNQAFFATVIALAGAGDRILLTNPCYFNHETTLAMLGIGVDTVALDPAAGFLPDPAAVEAAIGARTRALALVSPNNPTGAIYPPRLLDDLFSLCRRRGIRLILDETYRDFLSLPGAPPHRLLGESGWDEILVQLYSFSKSFCIPGHRLGAVATSPALVAEIAKVMDNLQICAPRPAQVAVAQAIDALAPWREDNRREIVTRAQALDRALAGLPGWRIEAMGAYFAYVRHPLDGAGSADVAERMARELGVVVLPGGFFGRGQDAFLRFAFANLTADRIMDLPRRLDVLRAG